MVKSNDKTKHVWPKGLSEKLNTDSILIKDTCVLHAHLFDTFIR